jgi:hypothetical protein
MKSARRSEALREEMEFHLAEKAAALEADGMTAEHARAEARRRFGNVGLKHEESREIWMTRFVSELGQDVRYGLRMLVKKPTLTIVAVLTLALGVGANTAIFSIVDAVLLRSLPYRDPDRLVRIFFNEPGVGLRDVRFSKPELDDLQTRAGVFEDVTPIFEGSENLTGAGQPERLEGVNGSFSYFSMLGVTPQIGRLFGPQDFAPGFIDGVPHIYVSTYQDSSKRLSVVLRTSLPAALLEPQIRHEIQSIDPGLPAFGVSSMNDVLDRSLASRRFSADLVGGFAGLAVLLASIGIYGLLAYMVGQRSREIGLRIALGARRWDVLRLILSKGAVLAGVGIVAGMIVSAASASMMASLLYGVHPHDLLVFLAVPLLLFVVAVLASYLPARRATKVDPMFALREG